MNKKELKEVLDEKGIEYAEDATNDELEALIPAEEEEGTEDAVEEEEGGDVALVEWNGGSREYTREIHGDDFVKLAKQFAGKDKIKGVVTIK